MKSCVPNLKLVGVYLVLFVHSMAFNIVSSNLHLIILNIINNKEWHNL